MNLVILGIFSFNTVGLEGAIVQSLSHGFVASALYLLFFMIGIGHVLLNIMEDWLPCAHLHNNLFYFSPYLTLVFLGVVLWVLILAGSFK
jgi:hypothetical protein